jgi:hypothetical protein
MKIWNKQAISEAFDGLLKQAAEKVHNHLMNDSAMSNIGQYCKRPACWDAVKHLEIEIPEDFIGELVDENVVGQEIRSAKSGQKIENDIQVETHILDIGEANWRKLRDFGKSRNMISPKEDGILAYLFKNRFVSAAQGRVLLSLFEKMQGEGFELSK